ncbi:insulinase family protein [Glaciecola sp. SC05]|uniref:insulinase family protein n=1 Tax=Glaciecola sp. SC05 TaxID=1987355 RepID=UPI003527E501
MYLLKSAEQNLVVDTLPNKLKLAVIRSDNINAPIISISVAVGYYHETNHCYGFSHLLEHMIFHRSKNSDSSEALEKHVSKHSGYINAWTQACHTNFHLSCANEGFAEAVDMLIDKITHPSFAPADIKTEIAAIDEEYRLKLEDPIRGLLSVKKAIANPSHPFHRFSVGNQECFVQISAEEMQQQLHQHHQQYFHSGNIAVCIKLPKVGNYDDVLLRIKDSLGETISAKESNYELALPSLYLPEMTHKWVNLRLQHSHCQLVMCWLIEKTQDNLDNKALSMVRQLLESKHKNGLFDTLSKQGLVRALALTGGIEQPNFEEVQLHLTLAPAGLENKDMVLSIIAGYLAFLAQSQLANWRFSELEKQNRLLEQYAHKKDPVETCISVAQSLHGQRPEFEQASVSYHQAKTRILAIIKSMQARPHHVYYIDENAACDKQSDFYAVPYSVKDFGTVKEHDAARFMLAPQNSYLPSQLVLVTPETPLGSIEVIDKHGVLLKFAQLISKDQPNGDCFISINSPAMCDTLAHSMSKKVWVEGFTVYLQKRFYQADDAGISFRVYGHQHGLTIHTTGFSEKQLLLAIEIVNCMIAFHLNEDEFNQVKQAIIKRLSTRLLQKPINQMFANLNTLIQGDTYSIAQQVQAVERLNFTELNAHQKDFFKQNCVEALLVGNWRLHAAQKMHQQLQSRLTAKALWKKPAILATAIPKPCLPSLPVIQANDTAIVLYQQVRQIEEGVLYIKERATAICLILEHILGPHVFLRLRNDKQLAYMVGVGYKPINSQPGLAIYLQSSKSSADTIYNAMIEAISELLDDWLATEKELEHIKLRVAQQCEPLNKDVSNVARRLWANFEHHDPFFHYKILQQTLMQISSEEIKNWLEKLTSANEGQVLLTNDINAPMLNSFKPFSHRPTVD